MMIMKTGDISQNFIIHKIQSSKGQSNILSCGGLVIQPWGGGSIPIRLMLRAGNVMLALNC